MRERPSPNKTPEKRRSTQEEDDEDDDDGDKGGVVDDSVKGKDELKEGTEGGSEKVGKSDFALVLNQTGMPKG